MKPITSIAELKQAALYTDGCYHEFYVVLAGGLARSCKRILYIEENQTFNIINEIDDTEQEDLTEDQLRTETNIVEAIEKGCFFQY